jgi:type IX secretion system PorP/SprF family membrane protein
MKHSLYILSFILLASLQTTAQQDEVPNQTFQDHYVVNPAAAALRSNRLQASLFHRSRWADIDGAPTSTFLALSGCIPKMTGVGLGLTLSAQQRGLTESINAHGTYAYRYELSAKTTISAGLSAGVVNQRIDFGNAVVLDQNDPMVLSSDGGKTVFDASAGFMLKRQGLVFGFAASRLLANNISYSSGDRNSSFNLERSYLSTIQYAFTLKEKQQIEIIPQVLVAYSAGAPLRVNGGLNLDWRKVGWVGAMYNLDYGVSLNAGVRIRERFQVGYSYDFISTGYKSQAGLSHEIFVGFSIPSQKRPQEPDSIVEPPADTVVAHVPVIPTDTVVADVTEIDTVVTPAEQEEVDIDHLYDLVDLYFELSNTKESTIKNYDTIVVIHKEIDRLVVSVLEEDQKLIRESIEEHDDEIGFVMPPDETDTPLTPEEQEKVDIDKLYSLVDTYFELTATTELTAKNKDQIIELRLNIKRLLFRVDLEEQRRIEESIKE